MPTLSRREVLLSSAGAAALGLSGNILFIGGASAQDLREQGFHRYTVGDVEVTSLYDGIWRRELDEGFIRNASLEEAKAALADVGLDTDIVPIEFAQTVLKIGDRVVLIDAGTGGQLAPTAGRTMDNLTAAGFRPEEIGTILVSHFHPDHIFGLMAKDTNAPIFPEAEILVPETELAYWTDTASLPEANRGLGERVTATLAAWDNVGRFSGESEVVPGVHSLPAHGHTPGHTAFVVASGDEQLIVAGDVANVPALFVANPGWHAVFDVDPDVAEATRRRMFDRVVADGTIIAGYHFGFPNAGRLSKDGDGYVFERLGG